MRSIYLVLTEQCNLSCPSCIRNNIPSARRDFDVSNFDTIISFIEHTNANSIVLTGGEPFMFNEWEFVLNKCIEKFKHICICTNGMISDHDISLLYNFMEKGIYLQISIDGDYNTDAKMRGNEHFNAAIKTVKHLERYANQLVISTSIDKRNISGIPSLIELLNLLKFSYWKISWVQSLNPMSDKFILNSQEWNDFVDLILPLCYFNVRVPKLYDFNIFEKSLQSSHCESQSVVQNCGAGANKIYIFPNGDVYPCSCVKDWKIGNIFVESFDMICQKLDLFSQISIPSNSACVSCKYKKICNSGCPGYSYKVFGDIGYGDIRCPIIKQYYDQKH